MKENKVKKQRYEVIGTLNNNGVPYLSTANCGMIKLRKSFGEMPYLCVYGDGTASRLNLPLR